MIESYRRPGSKARRFRTSQAATGFALMEDTLMRVPVILLSVSLLASDSPKKGAPENDRARLQGNWYTTDQKSEDLIFISSGGDPSLSFQGDKLICYGFPAGRYTIDATKEPKTIDMIYEAGPPAGLTDRGIYKLEGGVLTICLAKSPNPRPHDFTVPKGSKRILTVYKRKP
jgi:uncharacterized protein (TIGR03067 family)